MLIWDQLLKNVQLFKTLLEFRPLSQVKISLFHNLPRLLMVLVYQNQNNT